jgi:hypothetical protein
VIPDGISVAGIPDAKLGVPMKDGDAAFAFNPMLAVLVAMLVVFVLTCVATEFCAALSYDSPVAHVFFNGITSP